MYLVERGLIYKVGIANIDESGHARRIDTHRANGYSVLRVWRLPKGSQAREVETDVLDWWRLDLGAPAAADPSENGWTETAHKGLVPLAELIDRIDEQVGDLGGAEVSGST